MVPARISPGRWCCAVLPRAAPAERIDGADRIRRAAGRDACDDTTGSAVHYSSVDRSSPSVAQSVSDVSSAFTARTAEISADIYGLLVREIPRLRGDKREM